MIECVLNTADKQNLWQWP